MAITKTLLHLALAASICLAVAAAQGAPVTFSSKELCVEGVAAPLEVEVAETQAQRNRGLGAQLHLMLIRLHRPCQTRQSGAGP